MSAPGLREEALDLLAAWTAIRSAVDDPRGKRLMAGALAEWLRGTLGAEIVGAGAACDPRSCMRASTGARRAR